jgi:hypothetical protein
MSYDGKGGEPDEMRLRLVPWFLRSFPGALRGGTNSEVHRRGRKRDLFRCTLSAHGKEGSRRHPGQFECPGLQFHQSTERPPFSARGSSAGLFRVACPAPTLTDTIHSRSYGTARAHLRALTKSVAEPNPVLRFATRRRCCFYGRFVGVSRAT